MSPAKWGLAGTSGFGGTSSFTSSSLILEGFLAEPSCSSQAPAFLSLCPASSTPVSPAAGGELQRWRGAGAVRRSQAAAAASLRVLPLFLTVSSSLFELLCGRKEQHQQLEEGGRSGRQTRAEHLGAASRPRWPPPPGCRGGARSTAAGRAAGRSLSPRAFVPFSRPGTKLLPAAPCCCPRPAGGSRSPASGAGPGSQPAAPPGAAGPSGLGLGLPLRRLAPQAGQSRSRVTPKPRPEVAAKPEPPRLQPQTGRARAAPCPEAAPKRLSSPPGSTPSSLSP